MLSPPPHLSLFYHWRIEFGTWARGKFTTETYFLVQVVNRIGFEYIYAFRVNYEEDSKKKSKLKSTEHM